MKTQSLCVLAFALFFLPGCSRPETTTPDNPQNVIEITATGLTLDGPSEIPSGWTTIRFKNLSGMTHFTLFNKMPDGYASVNNQEEVVPAFQKGMDFLNAGEGDKAGQAFGELPPWFFEMVPTGGPGFVAGGRTAESTVFLEPGTYVIECYVKTNGIFHTFNPDPDVWGMIHEIIVTEEVTGATPPEASVTINLSRSEGIVIDGQLKVGENVVAVNFVDQGGHENFVGHDVHLLKVDDGTDLDELEVWMDWRQPTGLETPSPVEFIGGTNEMQAGQTTYISISLEPGHYAWIAEVPNAREKGMLIEFEVGTE